MKAITLYTANKIDLRPNLDIVSIQHENFNIAFTKHIEAEKSRLHRSEIFIWIGTGKGFVLKEVEWGNNHLSAKISEHNLSILLGLLSNQITSL